jgi:hypothetical protein
MPTWPQGTERQAKAWEDRGHFVHYEARTGLWECWKHAPDACEAVTGGVLAVQSLRRRRTP